MLRRSLSLPKFGGLLPYCLEHRFLWRVRTKRETGPLRQSIFAGYDPIRGGFSLDPVIARVWAFLGTKGEWDEIALHGTRSAGGGDSVRRDVDGDGANLLHGCPGFFGEQPRSRPQQ